jgi:replicative DNA helicase
VPHAQVEGPSNLAFEVGVLGAALWSQEGLLTVLDKAREDDFSVFAHRKLFGAIMKLSEDGVTPTVDVIEQHLRQDGSLELLTDGTISGDAYLDYLHENAALAANVPHFINNLRACSSARGMIITGGQLVNLGRAFTGANPETIAEAVEAGTESMWRLSESTIPQNFLSIGEIVSDGYDEIVNGPEETTIIPTGFADLDKQLHGGLKAQQVCVVAARPAVGKSVFGLNVAAYASIKRGIPAVFYSLEMSRLELATRLMASQAKVPLDRLQEGQILPNDDENIRAHIEEIKDAPLYIDDTPGVDISMLAGSIRFMRRRYGIQLVVLDYLQLVAGRKGEKSRRGSQRVSRTEAHR